MNHPTTGGAPGDSPGIVSPITIAQAKKKFLMYATNLAVYGVSRQSVDALVDLAFDGVK